MRPFICLVILFVMGEPALRAETARSLIARGNQAFQKGEFEAALALYDEASVELPESAEVSFNRGAVFYKQEDYKKAVEAFKHASLKSKGTALTSRAKFNLGNCAFRQAQRQRESDLEKTIEFCRVSIDFYQEARDLEKEFTKAAENIEIVRLYLKVLLDEQQRKQQEGPQGEEGKNGKEEEKNKGEDEDQPEPQDNPLEEIVKKLQELLERQEKLRTRDLELLSTQPKPEEEAGEDSAGAPVEGADEPAEEPAEGPPVSEELKKWQALVKALRVDQETLKEETEEVHGKIKEFAGGIRHALEQPGVGSEQPVQPGQQTPDPQQQKAMMEEMVSKVEAAGGHVGTATTHEQVALSDLVAGDLESVAQSQERARDSLEAALKELADPNEDQRSQDQSGNDQENKDQKDHEEKEEGQNEQDQEKEEGESGEDQKESQQGEDDRKEQPNRQSEPKSEEELKEEAKRELVEDILKEEKRNQKRRPVRPGQVVPVDRDW